MYSWRVFGCGDVLGECVGFGDFGSSQVLYENWHTYLHSQMVAAFSLDQPDLRTLGESGLISWPGTDSKFYTTPGYL